MESVIEQSNHDRAYESNVFMKDPHNITCPNCSDLIMANLSDEEIVKLFFGKEKSVNILCVHCRSIFKMEAFRDIEDIRIRMQDLKIEVRDIEDHKKMKAVMKKIAEIDEIINSN